jgi:hypothetical protein
VLKPCFGDESQELQEATKVEDGRFDWYALEDTKPSASDGRPADVSFYMPPRLVSVPGGVL